MRLMSATPALLAVAYSVPVSVWWFAKLSMMPSLPDPAMATVSLQALQVLVATQVITVCLCGPLWTMHATRTTVCDMPVRQRSMVIASALLPSWPLLVMLGFAAGVSTASLALTQVIAAGIGLCITTITILGLEIRATAEVQRLIGASIGVAAAAGAWQLRTYWLQWVLP